MTKQRKSLEILIRKCRAVDPDCGVMLQGSVARGEERPESDVDLTIVTSMERPSVFNEIITETNQVKMIRVHLSECDMNVDVNWIHHAELSKWVKKRGGVAWYMFAVGKAVHDPAGLATKCQGEVRDWFSSHPKIHQAWIEQQADVEENKRNPDHHLCFPKQPEFCRYLQGLVAEK